MHRGARKANDITEANHLVHQGSNDAVSTDALGIRYAWKRSNGDDDCERRHPPPHHILRKVPATKVVTVYSLGKHFVEADPRQRGDIPEAHQIISAVTAEGLRIFSRWQELRQKPFEVVIFELNHIQPAFQETLRTSKLLILYT